MQLTLQQLPRAAPFVRRSRHAHNDATAPGWTRQQLHRAALQSQLVARASHVEVATAPASAAAPVADTSVVVPAEPSIAPSTNTTALSYTSYEGNSFYVQFAKSGVNVLVDPWLVGKLTFGGLDFVYAGSKRLARPESIDVDALATATDILLLTQGIDDHAHKPTLQRLPKTLPVVASPAGAAVARSLGFRTIYTLDANQSITLLDGRLTIQGTAGALVGPPWSKRELGVILRENVEGSRGTSLYYEPHADYLPDSVSRAVAQGGPVDVVVSPPCSQVLQVQVLDSLLGYPLVKGATDNLNLLRLVRPKVFIPLMNAEIDQEGPLAQLVVEEGSVEQLQQQLAAQPELANIRVCMPTPAQPMPVQL